MEQKMLTKICLLIFFLYLVISILILKKSKKVFTNKNEFFLWRRHLMLKYLMFMALTISIKFYYLQFQMEH